MPESDAGIDLAEELVAIFRLFAAVEKEQVCGGTVTIAQCVALQTLLKGPSEAALLADRHGVSRSAMTRLLDGLERKKWIARTRVPNDRRRVTISLTPAGEREAKRLRSLTKESIDLVLAAIPKRKRGQIVDSIVILRKVLEQHRCYDGGCSLR